MNAEIQKWYKALEEADKRAEAGDEQARKDAFEIADTIRRLEEQQTPVVPADLADPMMYGVAGAIPATVKAGANLFRAEVPPAGRAPGAVSAPAVASAATSPLGGIDVDRQIEGTQGPGGTGRSRMGFNTITQQRAELGQQAKENLRWLQQKGLIDSPKIPQAAASTRSGILLTQGGLEQIENAPPPPKPTIGQRLTQSIKEVPATASQAARNVPGAVVRGAANLPLRATAGGFAGGALAADAYNYRELAREAEELGDTKAAAYYNSMAAASGLGSGAGFLGSFAPSYKPKTRALAIPAAGLALYNYLQSQKGYPAPGQDVGQAPPESKIKSVMQGYARGHAVKGYANRGKVVAEIAVGKTPPGLEFLKKAIKDAPLWERFGYDPKKIAQQYPDVLPPTLEIDKKTGKQYLAKQLSPEALAVQKARQAAQKEIDTGSPLYQPYFDITKRSYVNPADYPLSEKTLDLTMPKKADTLARHRALAQSPEATARLEGAYEAAAGSPTAHGFYMMKQLQDEYISELGPEAGRLAFKRDFADPMAATTGKQTPTANLMMTAMHNYFANKGMPMPSKGYDLPYPVGGKQLQSNIDMSQKLFNTGSLSAADSPKRFNFSSNFLGHSDRPTIDEQMMGLFQPGGKKAPEWYGVNEEAVNILAKNRGVDPVNYQEVAWAGAKGYPGQPMIEDLNQMIYRTHRITGEPQREVVRRFIRREGPMYGITGLGALQAADGVNNPE